jgi:hypothetical protein
MDDLFHRATQKNALRVAWQKIRSNGILSSASETRVAVEMFGRDTERNISKIQKLLRADKFLFDPQKGVLKKKGSGGKRGIVMASVHNRVVERALLDCLQANSEFIKKVINQQALGAYPTGVCRTGSN